MIIALLQNIGHAAFRFLAVIGKVSLFTFASIRWTIMPPYYMRQLGRQMLDIGYYSLPVVGLTTLFSGMVLALQSYTGFARFSAEDTVATVVVLSVCHARIRACSCWANGCRPYRRVYGC